MHTPNEAPIFEVWVRVLGQRVLYPGIHYVLAARWEARQFMVATVPVRLSVIVFFGALWIWRALGAGKSVPAIQLLKRMARLMPSAASVPTAPDSRYTPSHANPNCAHSANATSGAKAAPISHARSEVSAAPV
jgi:hypothetical protein